MCACKAGDWVEVRSLPEILATLDSGGKSDSLPFIPEMIQFCGKKFRVSKRAEKTCFGSAPHRLGNAVHLADIRCDGAGHDGCQANCLLFWRESWLKPVPATVKDPLHTAVIDFPNHGASASSSASVNANTNVDIELRTRSTSADGSVTYICQATALREAARERLKLWDLGQYYREFRVGNAGWPELKQFIRWFLAWVQWRIFKLFSRQRTMPVIDRQNITCGDVVEVRSKKEILSSLTKYGRHHGLPFSAKMLTLLRRTIPRPRPSGKNHRRKNRQDESPEDCLTLDSVTCRGNCTLCPRSNFHFWRSEWLRRVEDCRDTA